MQLNCVPTICWHDGCFESLQAADPWATMFPKEPVAQAAPFPGHTKLVTVPPPIPSLAAAASSTNECGGPNTVVVPVIGRYGFVDQHADPPAAGQ